MVSTSAGAAAGQSGCVEIDDGSGFGDVALICALRGDARVNKIRNAGMNRWSIVPPKMVGFGGMLAE
jgi:hypothetical protein